jgi:hypothetical protein
MANNEQEHMGDDVIKEVVGMFEDLDSPSRAKALQELADTYCLDCGDELPENEDEDCPCQDDEGDEDDDGDDEDADEDEDEDDGEHNGASE